MGYVEPDRRLEKLFPEIASEYVSDKNDLPLEEITAKSNRIVWWRGSCGHLYKSRVASRTNQGTSCTYCSGNAVLAGFNDFGSNEPELSGEWDHEKNGLSPDFVAHKSSRKFWWKCTNAHSFFLSPYERAVKGRRCQYCDGRKVWPGFNDLQTQNPKLAKMFNTKLNMTTPDKVLFGSTRLYWWDCPEGHPYEQRQSLLLKSGGCPYCSNQKLLSGFNDLETRRPKLLEMWDYEKNDFAPSELMGHSKVKVHWKCKKGHTWLWAPRNMKDGCKYCSNHTVWPSDNDLEAMRPDIAREWDHEKNHPVKPNKVLPAARRKYFWRCAKGHSWEAAVNSRTIGGGCPWCSGKSERPLPGQDLESKFPDVAVEWDFKKNHPLLPSDVFPSSGKKVHWICGLGHSFTGSPNQRVRPDGITRCTYCAGKKVLKGFNDLASVRPDLEAEWDIGKNSQSPDKVFYGSTNKAHWVCSEGHRWEAIIYSRSKGGNGCSSCSKFGYKAGEPSTLYFLENKSLGARKIGITNSNNSYSRIGGFLYAGWSLLLSVSTEDGATARSLETAVLKDWIRVELQMPQFLTAEDMGRLGGETETFSIEGPSNSFIIDQIKMKAKSLGVE